MGGKGRRQDHYEVLGVSSDAPDQVIRAAYRALAAKYHPDRNPSDGDAELRLKRLNAALHVLGDPVKRKKYDELTFGPTSEGDTFTAAGSAIPDSGSSPASTQQARQQQAVTEADRQSGTPKRHAVFRKILKVVGGLMAIGLCGIAGVVWFEIESGKKYDAEQAAVTIDAEYRPESCSADHPILVRILNSSSRTVKEVSFELQLFEAGLHVGESPSRFCKATNAL